MWVKKLQVVRLHKKEKKKLTISEKYRDCSKKNKVS